MMKWFIFVIATGFAALAVAAGTSPAATTPTNFTLTTTLDGRDYLGGCCTDSIDATSTGAFPRIGRATLSATYFRCPRAYYCTQPNGDSVLSLQFVTPTGDTLTLVGYGDDTGTGTWMVGSSTGRFAKATGSGTYSVTYSYTGPFEYPYTSVTLTVSLRGNLSFAPPS
jgi:hypothetical protein